MKTESTMTRGETAKCLKAYCEGAFQGDVFMVFNAGEAVYKIFFEVSPDSMGKITVFEQDQIEVHVTGTRPALGSERLNFAETISFLYNNYVGRMI